MIGTEVSMGVSVKHHSLGLVVQWKITVPLHRPDSSGKLILINGDGMAIIRNPMDQAGLLKKVGLDAQGVCLEACRRWITAVLESRFIAGDTVYEIINPETIEELLIAHRKRNTKKDKQIENLHFQVTSRTSGGVFSKFEGLRDRQDVIDHILKAPSTYIFVVDAANGGGHAFAFNTIDRKHVLFFDPNLGEWQFDDEDDHAMQIWWHNFWKGSDIAFTGHGLQSYKDTYTKGGRELWQYSIPESL
jgi:hypothetical protein